MKSEQWSVVLAVSVFTALSLSSSSFGQTGDGCVLECPEGALNERLQDYQTFGEGEPDCGQPVDTVNGGCSMPPGERLFTELPCADDVVICGSSFREGLAADEDWYKITVTERSRIRLRVEAEFDVLIGFLLMPGRPGSARCEDGCCLSPAFIRPACSPLEETFTLEPENDGVYYFLITPFGEASVECGSRYTLEFECRQTETVCPENAEDFLVQFGNLTSGDALELCEADDRYLHVTNRLPVTPLLPYIGVETWAHASLGAQHVTLLEFKLEMRLSAIVGGGQNGDAMRTFVRNHRTADFELFDERATNPFIDSIVTFGIEDRAGDYVNPGDGEVRVRLEAWSPGRVINADWGLLVDLYQVEVSE